MSIRSCSRAVAPSLGLCLLALLGACSRSGAETKERLTVFAASSLTEAFQDLEREFEGDHPEVDVVLTFAGSQVLRLQIEHGAPAQVFASANAAHMDALVEVGRIRGEHTFARNELVVIVPKDNPAGIGRFEDLPQAKRIVVGSPSVPAGRYAQELLNRASKDLGEGFGEAVRGHVVSEESNVRLVRAKVELGEADAAIVYRTDVVATTSEDITIIEVPEHAAVRVDYHVGLVAEASGSAAAEAWVRQLNAPKGRKILARHGFLVEPAP
jgi:molybdate transport system substrate-binding protein